MKEAGVNTGTSQSSAVVPWVLGDSNEALRMAKAMSDRGIWVQPIIAPAVEESAARLRFFVTADHTGVQLETLVAAVKAVCDPVTS